MENWVFVLGGRRAEGGQWALLWPPVVPRGRPVQQQRDATQCSGAGGEGGGGGGKEEEAGLHATASAPAPPYPVSRHPQEYSVNSNFAFNGGRGGDVSVVAKATNLHIVIVTKFQDIENI